MIVRCAWCGCAMPANNAEPRAETSHGMCVECLAVNFPDEYERMNDQINGDEYLAMQVDEMDLGPLPVLIVWGSVLLMLLFAALLYWRLSW